MRVTRSQGVLTEEVLTFFGIAALKGSKGYLVPSKFRVGQTEWVPGGPAQPKPLTGASACRGVSDAPSSF